MLGNIGTTVNMRPSASVKQAKPVGGGAYRRDFYETAIHSYLR